MVARIVEIDVPGAPRFVIERPDGSLLMSPLASRTCPLLSATCTPPVRPLKRSSSGLQQLAAP